MKKRTLSIGGATYDLFLKMGSLNEKKQTHISLEAGSKTKVDQVIETSGGGACNSSVGLSRLGLDAAFCGVVGSDQWGEKLLTTMKKEGVKTDSATIVEHETSSFSIILSLSSGERSILYAPGVNEHLQDATFDMDAISKVDAVYLNHLSDASCMIEDNIIDAILKVPRMHLTWNPGGCQIKEGMHAPHKSNLLKITSLLLLNKEEAMTFSQSKTMEEALKKLSQSGVRVVCITDGKNGTTATDGKTIFHCPILPNVKVVDTTGAGDAFGIGATWALLSGKTLPEMLIAGTLNAASVVEHLGAQAGLLTETQILDRMKNLSVSVETRPL